MRIPGSARHAGFDATQTVDELRLSPLQLQTGATYRRAERRNRSVQSSYMRIPSTGRWFAQENPEVGILIEGFQGAWPAVSPSAQEPECTKFVHEDSEHWTALLAACHGKSGE